MKQRRVRPSSQKNENKYEKVRGKTTITEKNVPGSWFSVVVSCCSLIIHYNIILLLLLLSLPLLLLLLLIAIITFYCSLLLTFILYFCYGDGYHMLVKRVKSN